jgi:hypothetical protein
MDHKKALSDFMDRVKAYEQVYEVHYTSFLELLGITSLVAGCNCEIMHFVDDSVFVTAAC